MTTHAQRRAQQRAIPTMIDEWLDRFGEETYDGHGAIKRYFSRASIRQMEREFGRLFVRHNSRWLRAYKVERVQDGASITYGWLTRRVVRR